jgi:Spy/CpxP family protein refolding chaperone
MRRLIASTSLIAGLALSAAAFADRGPGPDGHGPGPGGPFMHEVRELDLSEAQRTQIKGFFDAVRQQGKASHEALRELHRSYSLATPGSSEFRTLTARLADAEAADARERVATMAELQTQVYGVLTPDQRSQLAAALAKLPEPGDFPGPRPD